MKRTLRGSGQVSVWSLLHVIGAMHSPVLAQSELQRQIDACGQLSVCNITVPSGVNVVTQPWNLRDKSSLTIRGDGSSTVIWFFATDPAPPLCMDTIGTRNIIIDGVKFALGNSSKRPGVLWIHGRGADSRSQEGLSVSNASFLGWYNIVAVALIGSENGLFQSAAFENAVPNTSSLFISRLNEPGITSPFGPVRVNAVTMTCTNNGFINCSFNHEGHVGLVAPANNDQGFGITLGTGVHDLWIQGGSTSQGARGGVLRILGPNNRRIAVIAPNWESESAKAVIVVDGYLCGLSVREGLLQASGPAIQVNGTVENLLLRPAEMLTPSIIQFGPTGKLTGRGLTLDGFAGQ